MKKIMIFLATFTLSLHACESESAQKEETTRANIGSMGKDYTYLFDFKIALTIFRFNSTNREERLRQCNPEIIESIKPLLNSDQCLDTKAYEDIMRDVNYYMDSINRNTVHQLAAMSDQAAKQSDH